FSCENCQVIIRILRTIVSYEHPKFLYDRAKFWHVRSIRSYQILVRSYRTNVLIVPNLARSYERSYQVSARSYQIRHDRMNDRTKFRHDRMNNRTKFGTIA